MCELRPPPATHHLPHTSLPAPSCVCCLHITPNPTPSVCLQHVLTLSHGVCACTHAPNDSLPHQYSPAPSPKKPTGWGAGGGGGGAGGGAGGGGAGGGGGRGDTTPSPAGATAGMEREKERKKDAGTPSPAPSPAGTPSSGSGSVTLFSTPSFPRLSLASMLTYPRTLSRQVPAPMHTSFSMYPHALTIARHVCILQTEG